MNAQEIIAKADRGEGLTEEEIKIYRCSRQTAEASVRKVWFSCKEVS